MCLCKATIDRNYVKSNFNMVIPTNEVDSELATFMFAFPCILCLLKCNIRYFKALSFSLKKKRIYLHIGHLPFLIDAYFIHRFCILNCT